MINPEAKAPPSIASELGGVGPRYTTLAESDVNDLVGIVSTNTLGTMLCCREVCACRLRPNSSHSEKGSGKLLQQRLEAARVGGGGPLLELLHLPHSIWNTPVQLLRFKQGRSSTGRALRTVSKGSRGAGHPGDAGSAQRRPHLQYGWRRRRWQSHPAFCRLWVIHSTGRPSPE